MLSLFGAERFDELADLLRAPNLEGLSAERTYQKSESRRRWKNRGIAALTLVALATIVFGVVGAFLSVFTLMMTTGVYVAFFMEHEGKHTIALTNLVMSEICAFLDLRHDKEVADKLYPDPFERLGLVLRARRRGLSNHITGVHRGIRYDAVSALLGNPKTDDERAVTLFNGVLARIEVPKSAPSSIAIVQDYGAFFNSLLEKVSWGGGPRRSDNRIAMPDEAFEKRFAVYCEDPDLARRFVTPGVMRALVRINDTLGEGAGGERHGVSGAFEGNTFYLAISRRSGFLSVNFIPDETLEETIHALFEDMALLREVIDLLHES
jgi:hypothetical protein